MDKPQSRSFLWLFPVLLVFAFAVFGIGVYMVIAERVYAVMAAGCASVFAVLGAWALSLSFQGGRSSGKIDEVMAPLHERLQEISVMLNTISENQLISERAKTVAFRENERETLRRAIREEIARKDFEAALALVKDIEENLGYLQEADSFRTQIETLRQDDVRRRVDEVVAVIDRHCLAEQWNQALREAERLQRMFPEDLRVRNIPQEIERRRLGHKGQLLESWNSAVTRHDVDGSIEILKQLDLYLTPTEAENMQETARRIFKDKLQLLGQQFTIAVKDHNWSEAVRIGETLLRDFPNARMAQEVREKLDLLREKASAPEAARV